MRSLARFALLGAVVVAAGCQDQNVPYLTAPTTIPNTPTGIQNSVTGLFSATRIDLGQYIELMSGFARDAANFTNTEPRFITYNTGFAAMTNTWTDVWSNQYTDIAQARQIVATLPSVHPAYSAAQTASLTGIVQTMEAYNYMIVAEVYDTLGAAVQEGGSGVPPALCNKDVWAYIVSLLDSANAQLNVAGATPPPVILPTGFGAVSAASGPSTTVGTFAAFNRALAAKAGLELAYAIARGAHGAAAPTPTSAGTPDLAALTRADSAMTASALYNPNVLAPNPTGGWVNDGFTVMEDFSSSSGDRVNPIQALNASFWVLKSLTTAQDTVNDLRFKAKFVHDSTQIQTSYSTIGDQYHYGMYASPASPIPLVRDEELTLVRAEIQIGMGPSGYGLAATLINGVRTKVGGLTPATINTSDYVSVRDALLHEQQISTAIEPSGDRTIAIRMYGLAAVVDTTWGSTDQHTTIAPIPFTETSGRGGSWAPTCP
ncbi:MAG TPA: hypothetical protein VNW46_09900 [Gemmatimonadaceae bacterium]|nr:hypothetical protein [Gemmatimonadaceae bacterium]